MFSNLFSRHHERKFEGPLLQREWDTVEAMIELFCREKHAHGLKGVALCEDCAELAAFAELRLRKCPFGEGKSTCANCRIHCYRPGERERMKVAMRYAGPRMLLRHPILALRHKLDGFREAPEPPWRKKRPVKVGAEARAGA